MNHELATNGQRLLMVSRRPTAPIASLDMLHDTIRGVPRAGRELGPNQIAWCTAHLTGFAWPKVQRLAEKKEGV